MIVRDIGPINETRSLTTPLSVSSDDEANERLTNCFIFAIECDLFFFKYACCCDISRLSCFSRRIRSDFLDFSSCTKNTTTFWALKVMIGGSTYFESAKTDCGNSGG